MSQTPVRAPNSDFAVLGNFELSTSKGAVRCRPRRVNDHRGFDTCGEICRASSVGRPRLSGTQRPGPVESIATSVQIGAFATIVVGIKELLWRLQLQVGRGETAVLQAIKWLLERAAQLAMRSDGRAGPCSGADRRPPFILRRERLLGRHSPAHPKSCQPPPADRTGPLCSRYRPR